MTAAPSVLILGIGNLLVQEVLSIGECLEQPLSQRDLLRGRLARKPRA